jgi:hypothetical protein
MHRALAGLAAAVLAGCGAAATTRPPASPAPATAPATVTATATATPTATVTARAIATPTATASATGPSPSPVATAPPAPGSRDVSELDNGTTVTLRTGGTLRAVLHSTYWQFDPPSDPTVLGSAGPPVSSPAPMGQCVPGGGCGTVTATFQALRPGRAVVSAHRTSCGEALRCTGNQGIWTVTVVVSG